MFLLVGQSNMLGKGKIQHLEALIADSETTATFKHLKKGETWVELELIKDVPQAGGGCSNEREVSEFRERERSVLAFSPSVRDPSVRRSRLPRYGQ